MAQQATLFNFFKVTKEKRAQEGNIDSVSVKKKKIISTVGKKANMNKKKIYHDDFHKAAAARPSPSKIEEAQNSQQCEHVEIKSQTTQRTQHSINNHTIDTPVMIHSTDLTKNNGNHTKNPITLYGSSAIKDRDIQSVNPLVEMHDEQINHDASNHQYEEIDVEAKEAYGDNLNGIEDDYNDYNSVAHESAGLSEYEKLRLERIKQNAEYLSSLGLDSIKLTKPMNSFKAKKSKHRCKNVDLRLEDSQPVRRSTRNIISIDSYQPSESEKQVKNHGQVKVINNAASPLVEEDFADSDVFSYLIGGQHSNQTEETISTPFKQNNKSLNRLKFGTWQSFHEGVKTKWYSIDSDSRSGLVVAGGQGGRVSAFRMSERPLPSSSNEEGEDDFTSSLLSFKPHGSTWVSDVSFCGGQDQALASLLLTSANDGNVMLWDMTKQSSLSSAPKLINKSNWHSSGIWSMHCSHGIVATGAKDSSVSFGTISACEGVVMVHNEDIGLGHVKSVSLQTSTEVTNSESHAGLIAAACEEGSVMMLDTRNPQVNQGRLHIKQAHGGRGCMSVEWRPNSQYTLLSAGLDATIKVWDIRKSTESVHSLSGHVPPQHSHRLKQISRPRWLPAVPSSGNKHAYTSMSESADSDRWGVIAVQGEHTTKLTLYDALHGVLLSRGELGSAATTIANVGHHQPLVAVGLLDGTISFLVPDMVIAQAE